MLLLFFLLFLMCQLLKAGGGGGVDNEQMFDFEKVFLLSFIIKRHLNTSESKIARIIINILKIMSAVSVFYLMQTPECVLCLYYCRQFMFPLPKKM